VLKGLDPLLSPDLLQVLRAMGHGDEIVLVDRNFPAEATAQRLVRLDGVSLLDASRAVLSVLPLDDFVDAPLAVMQMVDTPDEVPEVQQEVFALANEIEGRDVGVEHVERFAFYERARQAFAVVATAERRPYGNVVMKKGVVR
jgi:L-fucose mutarotase